MLVQRILPFSSRFESDAQPLALRPAFWRRAARDWRELIIAVARRLDTVTVMGWFMFAYAGFADVVVSRSGFLPVLRRTRDQSPQLTADGGFVVR